MDDSDPPSDQQQDDSTASNVGVIALLDLPPGASVSIDGSAPHVVRRDDFVGVSGVPSPGGDAAFHLVAVRGGDAPAGRREGLRAAPHHSVGFVVAGGRPADGDGWIVARRYDPRTEEASSEPVDDLTASNLLGAVREGSVGPQRVVPYDRFVTGRCIGDWSEGTDLVDASLLRRRGLRDGDKIVPGSYQPDEGESDGSCNSEKVGCRKRHVGIVDGKAASYPPIPCIDPSSASPGRLGRRGHAGTRRYLASLSPSERTGLFLDARPGSRVLGDVLEKHYGGRWQNVLGDLQLSFVLFLHLGCLASFEHWRDLICMLTFAHSDSVGKLIHLYSHLVRIVAQQLLSVEKDFFEEVEYSGGNFLIPALERLCSMCSKTGDDDLRQRLIRLVDVVSDRFNVKLSRMFSGAKRHLEKPNSSSLGTSLDDSESSDDDENVMEIDMQDGAEIDLMAQNDPPLGESKAVRQGRRMRHSADGSEAGLGSAGDMDKEGDGPTIVAAEEVEASLARSSAGEQSTRTGRERTSAEWEGHRQRYPLLFAAMTPREDVLMACARILDEALDVSLVREAAAYLEEVEGNRDATDCAS